MRQNGERGGDARPARRTLPVVQTGEGWGVPPPHGERRDAAEHRRQILDTARALFAERGVDAVSMHEIARTVGIGQGTLYRRYAHKGELCGALMEDSLRRFQEDIVAHLGRDATGEAARPRSALAGLDYFLTRLVAFNEENLPLLAGMAHKAPGGHHKSPLQTPIYGWLHRTAAALLSRALVDGEIPPLDVEPLADAVLATLNIDLYLFQRRDRHLEPERIIATVRRLLFDGLRGDPPPRPPDPGGSPL